MLLIEESWIVNVTWLAWCRMERSGSTRRIEDPVQSRRLRIGLYHTYHIIHIIHIIISYMCSEFWIGLDSEMDSMYPSFRETYFRLLNLITGHYDMRHCRKFSERQYSKFEILMISTRWENTQWFNMRIDKGLRQFRVPTSEKKTFLVWSEFRFS